ncbi:D-alanyl-D-alanine endopeptidase [Chitinilyticum piscinae]|uniref:D-alanyl-D-alanine endopeptidase n=1 Tax=Chitinilyticum piscinae TaxID=2866724 RepID=A0A8J7FI29_9NEIS|nr:D-alanyl-D-alanine endopeptidase [Chitinilyticum piscinae]MBE9609670.1 D-alanyl-D-alanine endopeptidase [Chitinilyticum piscinae]
MRKALLYLTAALLSVGVAATSAASSTQTGSKVTKSSTKKVEKKQAKTQTSPSRKSAKTSTGKTSVKQQAVANARREVSVTPVVAAASTIDSPGLRSANALVLNALTGQVMYEKNADRATPIASITKVMTAMVVLDANLPLNELLTINEDDIDTLKNTTSRLSVGTQLTRGEMLLLALMSSENRAASALGRYYPGGKAVFIQKMNEKALQLGMTHSRFLDSNGLNPGNVSTPRDLALMVKAAARYPAIQQFSTSSEYVLTSNLSGREMAFRNTNPLVKSEDWEITLTKTGYISEAGRCLVMQTTINGAPVVMVLMDSDGKQSRIGDAQRVKKWLETFHPPQAQRAG